MLDSIFILHHKRLTAHPREGASYRHTHNGLTWMSCREVNSEITVSSLLSMNGDLMNGSQQAHFEATHLPHSEHTRWVHSETLLWALREFATHTVSLLWALREFSTQTVSLLWAIHEITRWAHHAVVAVRSLCELKTHGKLTLWAYLVSSLWANWVS